MNNLELIRQDIQKIINQTFIHSEQMEAIARYIDSDYKRNGGGEETGIEPIRVIDVETGTEHTLMQYDLGDKTCVLFSPEYGYTSQKIKLIKVVS